MSHSSGYEKRDVNIKSVFIFMFVSAIVVCVCLFGVDQYFVIANEKMYYNHVLKPENIELKELRQKETETLSNYKLLNADKGTVQLPIARAMELLVLEHSK